MVVILLCLVTKEEVDLTRRVSSNCRKNVFHYFCTLKLMAIFKLLLEAKKRLSLAIINAESYHNHDSSDFVKGSLEDVVPDTFIL